ncbi:hypothetical protein L6452_36764 [Arctium lappa]|uniref:Uncharacterized protein n=1 Tax=Arctium lappa TaxID=4217 RepID=A0ACB8Y178_ARCLA|nr:hypothetical protein L6452_36764 [Arctium lappa]
MVNTRSRVRAADDANEASVTAPRTIRQANPTVNQVIPPIPRILAGIVDEIPQVNLETEDPIIQEADPQDASNRRHETVGDNAVMGSGGVDNAVGTEEHAIRAEKKKEGGCSFKSFLCSRAPEFSGTTDPLACMKWIQEVEMAFEASECADTQRVKFASQILRGDALTWWNVTRRVLTPEVLDKITWPTFKKKLMEKFCNARALDKPSGACGKR